MGHFETILNKGLFVRTHRSFMVNITEITRIDPYEKDNHLAILKSGSRVPVSKSGYVKLKSVLGL
jgi:two-component system LytT family response regulator